MFDPTTLIMVADDMMTMRKIVQKSLTELGFKEFIEAKDGNEAWAKMCASEKQVGLVISDWNMPNCTGLEFLKKARADKKYTKVPFVLLTAESEASQVAEALKAGVDNYIVKPFNTEILKKKLEDTFKKVSTRK